MEVLVIIGSVRKKNTYAIIKEIENELNSNKVINFNYIFLNDLKIEQCKSCGYCKMNADCFIDDDLEKVKNLLMSSDVLIVASPVYAFHITNLMKLFIDRFHYFYFYPSFLNKIALVVSTGTIKGLKGVLKYLDFTIRSWGFFVVGQLGIIIPKYKSNKKYQTKTKRLIKKYANKILTRISSKKVFCPTMSDLKMFNDQKKIIIDTKDSFTGPYKFWNDKNWLSNKYFDEKNISFIKKIFIKFSNSFKN